MVLLIGKKPAGDGWKRFPGLRRLHHKGLENVSSSGRFGARCVFLQFRVPAVGTLVPSWKPVTLRAPLLGCLIAFPLILLSLLEYLSQQSHRNGGIVFTGKGFTGLTIFTYFCIPTILAVIYSMIWAWISLDTKRLEPYF